jgi:hypothetical protein
MPRPVLSFAQPAREGDAAQRYSEPTLFIVLEPNR